ncbi:MAG: cysteine desulfurase [Candidatus Hydrogenedentes bacterium]|nr:cysteine desulfurase [Candidatus Hydrogenedentota bacterium]
MTPIYLDHAATTPVDPRVLDAMLPFFTTHFGNAASAHHAFGKYAHEAVDLARDQVATALAADPREIVWTSGATESNNLALQGIAFSPYYAKRGNHIITVATEHKAVLDCCAFLETRGIKVTCLPVDGGGRIDLQQLADAITSETILVSIMHANNETGVLQPIREIGALCTAREVLFHTDATQSFGKVPIDIERDRIDLLSLSAHKIYGPKGVGALYVRRKGPRVRCTPLVHGGGHEGGLRSGTLNVPGIVGLGCAAEIATGEMETEQERIRQLRDHLEAELIARGPCAITRNGAPHDRLAGFANLSFDGIIADQFMARIPQLAVSARAACTSAVRQPSYVLAAMGCDEARIAGAIRLSLGRSTTRAEIDEAIRAIAEALSRG